MKQCIQCLSSDVSPVVEKDRIIYYCQNCDSKTGRVLNNSGLILTEKEKNGAIKHTTIGAIIKSKDGKYLFVKRKQYPYGYAIPAGHLNYGENRTESLKRSVFRETGLEISSSKLIHHQTIFDQCKDGADIHEWYVYDCKIRDEKIVETKEDKVEWFDQREMVKLKIVKPTERILKEIGLLEGNVSKKNDTRLTKSTDKVAAKDIRKSLIENLPVAVMVFDKKSDNFFCNKVAENLLKNISETKTDYIKFTRDLKKISERSINANIYLSSNIKLGDTFYNAVANPLNDNDQLCGSVITIKNISDQKAKAANDVLVYETSLALSSNLTTSKIIKNILKQVFLSMDISGCSLMKLDRETLKVAYRYSKVDFSKRKPLELKVGEGVAGWVAQHKTPLAITDTGSDPLYIGTPHSEEKSLLSVPALSSGILYGVLNVTRTRGSFFTEEEMKSISVVANRIALAIENDILYHSLNKEKNMMEKVLSSAANGFVMTNKNLDMEFANQKALEMMNLSGKKKNVDFGKFIKSKSGHDRFHRLVKKAIETKKIQEKKFWIDKKRNIVIDAIFTPIIEKNGACKDVLVSIKDISKLAQNQALIEKQARQSTALFKISAMPSKSEADFFHKVLDNTADILESERAGIFIDDDENYSDYQFLMDRNKKNFLKKIYVKIKNRNIKKGIILNEKTSAKTVKNFICHPLENMQGMFGMVYAFNKKSEFARQDLQWLGILATRLSSFMESNISYREIEKSRQQMQSIIENSGNGIFVYDIKSEQVMVWNKAIIDITGFNSSEEYIAANPDVNTKLRAVIREIEKTGKKTITKEIYVKNYDNETQCLGASYSLVLDKKKPIYLIATIHDLSKEKEMENRQREFVYTATHELRTPITAIKGYISMILNGDAGNINEKQKKYFLSAYSSTERLVTLVEDLLKSSNLEENSIKFERNVFPARQLLEEVVSEYRQKAEEKKLKIAFADGKKRTDVELASDYEKTKQAISNLVDNAIKYTSSGSINLKIVSKNKKYVRIKISDTGVGIPKKEQSNIYNKFYRVKNKESVRAGGTGLGLFIVKNLIEQQGGKIHLESKLGQGSTFLLDLPVYIK